MTKLKSFTITELIVVMVVSSIILLFVLWFFETVTRSYHKTTTGLENTNKTYSFINRMKREIGHSDYMKYSRGELDLYENDSVFSSYIFDKSLLIKKLDEITDTFPLDIGNVDTTSVYSVISGDYATSIGFDIIGKSNLGKVKIIKEYYSQILYLIENKQK